MYDELVKKLRYHRVDRDDIAEAADAIEALSAKVPQWIPVEERLPELGEEVLVYYHWLNPPEKCSITRDSMHIHNISMKPVWKKHIGYRITHWMPLPEPPEREVEA